MPDGGDHRAEGLGPSDEAAPCDRRPLSPHLRRPRKPLESLVPGRGHEGRVHGLQHGRADGEGQLPRAPSYKAEWTKDDAEKALAAALLDVHPAASKAGGTTVAQAVEPYLASTARKAEFGAETPLADVTASRISEYKAKRLSAVRTIGQGERAVERRLTAAAVNRPLRCSVTYCDWRTRTGRSSTPSPASGWRRSRRAGCAG
jgi:hypothetical protein